MDKTIVADYRVEIGSEAPDFELTSADGQRWRLSDQRGSVVALLLYPRNETIVCTKQLCSVRDHWQEYLDSKAVVVGVSEGKPDEHLTFARKYRLPMPLLADEKRDVTDKYNFHWIFPNILTRCVVVVDAAGIIRWRSVMLRAFRPPDKKVLTAIYGARADALTESYGKLTGK